MPKSIKDRPQQAHEEAEETPLAERTIKPDLEELSAKKREAEAKTVFYVGAPGTTICFNRSRLRPGDAVQAPPAIAEAMTRAEIFTGDPEKAKAAKKADDDFRNPPKKKEG